MRIATNGVVPKSLWAGLYCSSQKIKASPQTFSEETYFVTKKLAEAQLQKCLAPMTTMEILV